MPSDQDHNMEKPLRAYARKRREDAGEPALHPATRRLLQAEVAKLRPQSEARAGSFWGVLMLHWPRVGLAAAVFVGLVVVVWNFLPDGGQSSAPMTMAKNVEPPADFVTLGDETAPPARDGVSAPVEHKEAEKRLAGRAKGATVDQMDRLNEQALRFRNLTESAALGEALKPAPAGTDFDAYAGRGVARFDKKLADTSAYFALGSTVTVTNASSYGVALNGSVQTWHFDTGALGGLMAGGPGDGAARHYRLASELDGRSNAAGASDRLRGLSVNTASTSRPASVRFADDLAEGRAGGASLLAAKQEVLEGESLALRSRAPAGTAALGKETALGLAADRPASGPLAAEAKAKAGATPAPGAGGVGLVGEVAQVQTPVPARPENLFKEAQSAQEPNNRPLLLATRPAPPPAPARAVAMPVDAALPSVATPAPTAPSLTAAPAQKPTALASFGAHGGGAGELAALTVRLRFARQSAAEEVRAQLKDVTKTDGAAASAEPVLAVFDFEQSGSTVRLIDGDGSIYEGRTVTAEFMSDEDSTAGQQNRRFVVRSPVPRQPQEEKALAQEWSRSTAWQTTAGTNSTFRVSGTNRSSGKLVTFTGSLVSDSSVTNGRVISGVTLERQLRASEVDVGRTGATPDLRVLGRLRVGSTNETPLFAVPAAK